MYQLKSNNTLSLSKCETYLYDLYEITKLFIVILLSMECTVYCWTNCHDVFLGPSFGRQLESNDVVYWLECMTCDFHVILLLAKYLSFLFLIFRMLLNLVYSHSFRISEKIVIVLSGISTSRFGWFSFSFVMSPLRLLSLASWDNRSEAMKGYAEESKEHWDCCLDYECRHSVILIW